MTRPDISPYLVHWTKSVDGDDPFNNLRNIISEGKINGTQSHIRSGNTCVCFSEAPTGIIGDGLVNYQGYKRYSAFGIMFYKDYIFGLGGRPVIYQKEEEYNLLSMPLQWRHVKYDLDDKKFIDFTWEREWRLKCNELKINPSFASIVVPNRNYAERLHDEHEETVQMNIYQYSQAMSDQDARNWFDVPFEWHIVILNE